MDQPMVVMCAGGARSAFAVQTLQQLGYTNIVSMDGGFNGWKDAGKPWTRPRSLGPAERNRYQRHLLLPEVGEGQLALLDAKVLLLGAGGLGSPAALYLAAAGVGTLGISTWTRSTNQTCSVGSSTVSTRSVSARSNQPGIDCGLNPYITVNTYDMRLSADSLLST